MSLIRLKTFGNGVDARQADGLLFVLQILRGRDNISNNPNVISGWSSRTMIL